VAEEMKAAIQGVLRELIRQSLAEALQQCVVRHGGEFRKGESLGIVRVVEKEYPFVRVREGKGGDALASDVALGFPDPIISGIADERHVLDQTHCPILVQRA
jgi:hypothetical protein